MPSISQSTRRQVYAEIGSASGATVGIHYTSRPLNSSGGLVASGTLSPGKYVYTGQIAFANGIGAGLPPANYSAKTSGALDLVLTPQEAAAAAPSPFSLANLDNDTYSSSPRGFGQYTPLASAHDPSNKGFLANAYATNDLADIVVAVRGTDFGVSPTSIKNYAADSSFAGTIPTPLLSSEVADTAAFVASIHATYPDARITLSGHSLGGAVAQLVGKASGLSAITFNAPGAAQLYPSLESYLSAVNGLASGGANINYRIYDDQFSLFGESIGQTITMEKPAGIQFTTASNDALSVMKNFSAFLDVHSMTTVINQIANTNGIPGSPDGELNLVRSMQDWIQPTSSESFDGGQIAYFTLESVTTGVGMLLDPSSEKKFQLLCDPGSPLLSSIALPTLTDVATYEMRARSFGSWSTYSAILPGQLVALANDVDGVEFIGVDSDGNPLSLPDFAFYLTFASDGPFSGTFTESQYVPEPSSAIVFAASAYSLLIRRRRRCSGPKWSSSSNRT